MTTFYSSTRTLFSSNSFQWNLLKFALLVFFIVALAISLSSLQVMFRYDKEGNEKWWLYYFIGQFSNLAPWIVLTPLLTVTFYKVISKSHSLFTAIISLSFLIVVSGAFLATIESFFWYFLNKSHDWDMTRTWKAFIANRSFLNMVISLSILLILVIRQLYLDKIQQRNNKVKLKSTPSEHGISGSLVLKHRGRVELIPLNDITHLCASGSYVEIYSSKGKAITTGSLKKFADELPSPAFLRIHRSYIVRSDVVTNLIPLTNEDYKVIIRTGQELRLSRTYKESLSFLLGLTEKDPLAN